MLISNNQSISDVNIQIFQNSSSPLEFKQSVMYLGVKLDNSLKFNEHIKYICNKISRSIGILFKLRDFLPLSCHRQLYFCFVRSYISYCILVYGGTFMLHLEPLIILQKKKSLD